MSQQHAGFQQRLIKSRPTVFAVAEHMQCEGYGVQIAAVRVSPTAAEAEHYLDGGDLFVLARYEVKHRPDMSFTCAADYRFDDVIVGRKESVDRAVDAIAYIIVNAERTHAAKINIRNTKEHWCIRKLLASNTGNVETFYCCPKHLVEFIKLRKFEGQS